MSTKQLRAEDKHAVDLVLDRSAAAGSTGQPSYAQGDSATVGPRVQRLQHVLQLLELYVASEPPRDLVARTMGRIDSNHQGHALQTPANLSGRSGKSA
jgi:hypothetical protein